MKKTILLLVTVFVSISLMAEQMPEDYYNAANGKQDAELKTALYNIIKEGTRMSYGSGSWTIFYYSDRRADGSVWDMYSDEVRYFSGVGDAPSGMNIEHSFAKSWWGGANNDAYKDCYHLNPSDATANSARSNYPLGEVTVLDKTAGTLKIGTNPSYKTANPRANGKDFYIWEPKDEYKGDFARAYFYMATCYENLTWRLDNDDVGSKFAMQNDNYLEFQPWEQAVLLKWHRQDPVSQKEIDRMNAVSNYQHNRNPYIDFPCLVEYIWGDKAGQEVDFAQLKHTTDDDWADWADQSGCTCAYDEPTLLLPNKNKTLAIGSANRQETIYATLKVQGVKITEDLSLAIHGTDADLFTVTPATISAEETITGKEITLAYTPLSFGNHTAILTISSSQVSRDVNLTGVCEYNFHALPATDITSDGFIAHWIDAETNSYSLDVFTQVQSGVKEETLVSIPEITKANIEATENVSYEGTIYEDNAGFRLGTSNGTGSIVISNLNIKGTGKLTVSAKQYNNDVSTLVVSADDTTIKTFALTATMTDYTCDIPAGTQKITLTQDVVKKRIILGSLTLTQGGVAYTRTSISGYPKTVIGTSCNVTSEVNPLQYSVYYAVTPEGKEESNIIRVGDNELPDIVTVLNNSRNDFNVYVQGLQVTITDAPKGLMQVIDIMGRSIGTYVINGQSLTFTLPAQGIYLLRTGNGTIKIITQ